jgi:AraC family transcriptional regulator, transcriptional activator of pobA
MKKKPLSPNTSIPLSLAINFKDIFIKQTLSSPIIYRNDYWEIVLLKNGNCNHLIDFEWHADYANTVLFIMPHQVHQLNISEDSDTLSILITNDFFHYANENASFMIHLAQFQLINKIAVLNFQTSEFNQLWELISSMQEEDLLNRATKSIILKNYFNIFLCKCYDKLKPQNQFKFNSLESELLISFKTYIEHHFYKFNKIHYYLNLLNVTDKKLSAVCYRYLGISPSDYLHNRILIESKRLLRYGKLCQKEIAHKLNFTDVSHFMKFFKQRTGILPNEFAITV